MTKRVAFYAGVSTRTGGQTVEKQLRDLRAGADRLGRAVVATITNEGASGAKGRDRRPGSDALLRAVTRREVDLVATRLVCRLGRSLKDLVGFLAEVEARGVRVYLYAQALDITTPAGRALFQMLGIFSEFDGAMVVERVRAGLAPRGGAADAGRSIGPGRRKGASCSAAGSASSSLPRRRASGPRSSTAPRPSLRRARRARSVARVRSPTARARSPRPVHPEDEPGPH